MKSFDMGTFFIQVPPGLEGLALKELIFKTEFSHRDIHLERGGLTVQTTLDQVAVLNRKLKIPNRILLRLESFKCRDLPKLFNKISKLETLFFNAGQDFSFSISSQKSRLFDTRKIEATLKKALIKSFQAYPPKKKISDKILAQKNWLIFCRLEDDTCTLSLDLSGERLGKRGYKESSGIAPMRENLASAMWYFLTYDLEPKSLREVLDPYSGTGTMLFEAALFDKEQSFRTFTSDAFTQYQKKDSHQKQSLKLVAVEQDLAQVNCLKLNEKRSNVAINIHSIPNTKIATDVLETIDLIITNPPYNDRVNESAEFWKQELFAKRIGIVLPETNFPKLINYKVIRKLSFKHGGKKVVFKVFEKTTLPS